MFLPLFGALSSYSGLLSFVGGLVLLIVGYMTYGRFVERVLAPDDRKTPAIRYNDGGDYIVMPQWKNMLIQLLNIAGIGPVIGVIAGIKFGSIVFILIPIGNIIGGAVHDFISGMASLRNRGGNLPGFIKLTLGKAYYGVFSVFMIFLLLLVVAVFINVPAHLVDNMVGSASSRSVQEYDSIFVTKIVAFCSACALKVVSFFNSILPGVPFFWIAVGLIFIYYIIATMFPVDKIIGMFYPIFGGVLLLGSLALLVGLLYQSVNDPSLLLESDEFIAKKTNFLSKNPLIPCLFVTIACGILSGFHATQAPIIARTMKSEKEARASFYGMMILEGVIAMIWAGAALVVYNLNLRAYAEYWTKNPNDVLPDITGHFLGSGFGTITVIAVIVLAITSGDTAMRSMRLSLAEMLKINQKPIGNRIAICLPLILLVSALLWWSNLDNASFGKLWNYFAWENQVLAASTLGAGCVWLYAKKRAGWISAIPCFFMTFIVTTYILWTSPKHGGPQGVGLELNLSYAIGVVVAALFVIWCVCRGKRFARDNNVVMDEAPEYDVQTANSGVDE